MMKLADRMNNIPPYVFATVAERIREKNAQGIDILNLGIGGDGLVGDVVACFWASGLEFLIARVRSCTETTKRHHRHVTTTT